MYKDSESNKEFPEYFFTILKYTFNYMILSPIKHLREYTDL